MNTGPGETVLTRIFLDASCLAERRGVLIRRLDSVVGLGRGNPPGRVEETAMIEPHLDCSGRAWRFDSDRWQEIQVEHAFRSARWPDAACGGEGDEDVAAAQGLRGRPTMRGRPAVGHVTARPPLDALGERGHGRSTLPGRSADGTSASRPSSAVRARYLACPASTALRPLNPDPWCSPAWKAAKTGMIVCYFPIIGDHAPV